MTATVGELLKTPFLKRPRLDQQQIVAKGRPVFFSTQPIMLNSEDGSAILSQTACEPVVFEQVPWLTRCETSLVFFCWTCLLFSPPSAVLVAKMNPGTTEMLELSKKHESTEDHMENTLKLQIFISENFRTSIRVGDKTQHNLAVKRNREVLKRVIDAVCCAVIRKRSRGDGKYSYNLLNVEDCLKFLQLLRNCDKVNIDLVDGAIDLLNRDPRIVNNLVDAITTVVKMAIKNETHKSTYVSVILNEHGVHNGKSQISTVLRYIKRGKVCERFVGFSNVVGSNSENDVRSLILNTIEEYSISDRFLALSVDGAVLPKQSVTALIATFKLNFRYSYFVPWHSHGFGSVLLQALRAYEECELFLQMIKALENFFRNAKRFESFEQTLLTKFPDLLGNKWYRFSPFIRLVGMYRLYFIKFFNSMIENCEHWEADDITKATAFRDFLGEFRTAFLLHLFLKLFSDIFDETFNFIVDSKKFAFSNLHLKVCEFKRDISDLKFDFVWRGLAAKIELEIPSSKLKSQLNNRTMRECRALFQKITLHMCQDIDIRCISLSSLKFCDLLSCISASKFNNSGSRLLSALMVEHGLFFNENALRTEMEAAIANSEFSNKSVHELLECFAELNLRSIFPQLYKLSEFILTLPILSASCKKEISKLKDISDCSYIPETPGIPSGEASFLCVETEMLRDVKSSAHFYEDVLTRFYAVNRSLLLVQV